jgi:hypothetical protein
MAHLRSADFGFVHARIEFSWTVLAVKAGSQGGFLLLSNRWKGGLTVEICCLRRNPLKRTAALRQLQE